MKDLKEKEAPLIFRRLTLEINTSLPYFLRFLVHKSCLSQQFFVSLKANI